MPRVLERPAVDSTWAVSSSDICFRLSQRYVISQPQSKCQRCARCCQSCGTVPHIPQESQLIPHHGAHQKKVYALARMVRQSLTGMWWAGAGQSGAEQNRTEGCRFSWQKSDWLRRMEAMQWSWLWCCSEKAPHVSQGATSCWWQRVPGCAGIPACLLPARSHSRAWGMGCSTTLLQLHFFSFQRVGMV